MTTVLEEVFHPRFITHQDAPPHTSAPRLQYNRHDESHCLRTWCGPVLHKWKKKVWVLQNQKEERFQVRRPAGFRVKTTTGCLYIWTCIAWRYRDPSLYSRTGWSSHSRSLLLLILWYPLFFLLSNIGPHDDVLRHWDSSWRLWWSLGAEVWGRCVLMSVVYEKGEKSSGASIVSWGSTSYRGSRRILVNSCVAVLDETCRAVGEASRRLLSLCL